MYQTADVFVGIDLFFSNDLPVEVHP